MTDLLIPQGLFGKRGHKGDRYAVYQLIGRVVTFHDRKHGKVSGVVQEVYRDIFAGEIRLTIDGSFYRFKEPASIRINEKDAVFCYVEKRGREVSDKKMFEELKKEQFRESVQDTMKRMEKKGGKEVRFILGEKKVVRKKHSLMKGIPKEVL